MTLDDHLTEILIRLTEVERRQANMIRHAPVTDVDTQKQLLRVRLNPDSEDKPFKSAWIPYAQMAGDFKFHNPPVKDQNVTLFSPGGDPAQSIAIPFTWSEKFPSPSDKEDEHVITFGDITVTYAKEKLTMKVGDSVLVVAKDHISAKSEAVYNDGQRLHLKGSDFVKIGGGAKVDSVSGLNEATPPWVDGGDPPDGAPS